MVQDVTHENVWNGHDLALNIDGIIISYDNGGKSSRFKSGNSIQLTRTRNGVSRRYDMNFPVRVRKSQESTGNDRDDVCNKYNTFNDWVFMFSRRNCKPLALLMRLKSGTLRLKSVCMDKT
jgi:hypothetical protein